ncbi:hypothetical protein PENTCL1PPCAC_5983, partial [Pristionchus entomophagus]
SQTPCPFDSDLSSLLFARTAFSNIIEYLFQFYGNPVIYNIADHCNIPEGTEEPSYHLLERGNTYSCYAKLTMPSYLKRLDVQTALHLSNSSIGAK